VLGRFRFVSEGPRRICRNMKTKMHSVTAARKRIGFGSAMLTGWWQRLGTKSHPRRSVPDVRRVEFHALVTCDVC
jgi:hypothetical protein